MAEPHPDAAPGPEPAADAEVTRAGTPPEPAPVTAESVALRPPVTPAETSHVYPLPPAPVSADAALSSTPSAPSRPRNPAIDPSSQPAQARAYAPAQYTAPPADPSYGYAEQSRRLNRKGWTIIAAVSVVAVLVLGAVGYAAAGYLVAQYEISNARSAVNAVRLERTSINSAFDAFAWLSTDTALVSPSEAKAKAAVISPDSQILADTIAGNAQTLRSAQLKLNDLSWLTAFSRGSLQGEFTCLDHARHAVDEVKTAAANYMLLGNFMESYFQVFIDLDNLATAAQNNDAAGYANTFRLFRSDIAISLQLSNVPGLPSAHHDQLIALQAEASDIETRDLASARGDQAEVAAATKAIDADNQKANAIDFSGVQAAFLSYYEHKNAFNSELDLATC